jgi:hypothetical protein
MVAAGLVRAIYIVIERSYGNHCPLLAPNKTYLSFSFNRPGLAHLTILRVLICGINFKMAKCMDSAVVDYPARAMVRLMAIHNTGNLPILPPAKTASEILKEELQNDTRPSGIASKGITILKG